jgi:putative ABC transport system substrate-binding protein
MRTYRIREMTNRPAALFVVFVAGLLVAPLTSAAQVAGKVARIGVLSNQSRGNPPGTLALIDGLRELGYVEGESIVIEWLGARGDAAKFPRLAAALAHLKVDVIVATTNPAIQAARATSKTIPIVMVTPSDPEGLGFVRTLARPGGSITGLTWRTREAIPKQLQLLGEAVPRLSRVAVLWDATEPARRGEVDEAEEAAPKLGVALQLFAVRSPAELEGAFAAMTRAGVGAVLVVASTMLSDNRARLAGLAMKASLPTMGWFPEMADAGVLMSFSPHLRDQYRRAAYFVDKILKGAKPGDLPVEQPTKFELVVNLKTAKTLGLTIPLSILIQANRVVE